MEQALAEMPAETVETTEAPAVEAENKTEIVSEGNEGDVEVKPEPTEAEKIKYAMQKKVNREVAKRAEMERALQAAQDEILKLRPPVATNDAPQESDFETHEEYLKAVGKHEAKKEFEAEQARLRQESDMRSHQQRIQELQEKNKADEAKFREDYPDYDEKVQILNDFMDDLPKTARESESFKAFGEMMFASGNMAKAAYALAQKPELLEKMAGMTPAQVAWEMARTVIAAENAPKPKSTKTVSDPPSPVSGSKATASKDVNSMGADDLMKWFKS